MKVSMNVNLAGFDAVIDGLERDVQAALRPAAQAGAEVIYRAVMKNVNAIGKKSGNLAGSIYQAYSQDNSGPNRATYHVSWNAKKAPHGHLVEFGYIQRYEMGYENGKFFGPIVRPEKRGTPKPRRRASQAEKDAYWIPRKGGPKQVAARPFMRPAFYQQGAAIAAMKAKLFDLLGASK